MFAAYGIMVERIVLKEKNVLRWHHASSDVLMVVP